MKTKLLIACMTVIMLTGCQKDVNINNEQGQPTRMKVSVVPVNSRAMTGNTAVGTDESDVNTITVYVFNGTTLEGYAADNGNEVTVTDIYTGTREIIVIANAPGTFTASSSYEDVKNGLMELTTSGYVSSLVMAGSATETLVVDAASNHFTIDIKRLVARIDIQEITVDFSELTSVADPVLEITDIYLKNYYTEYNVSKIFNTRTLVENADGVVPAWTDSFSPSLISGPAISGTSTLVPTTDGYPYFYAAPNEQDPSGDWTGATLFVIKGNFYEDHAGDPTTSEVVYYVFELNRNYNTQSVVTGTGNGIGVFANMKLSLKIGISKKGSSTEEPSYLTECTVTGNVLGWDELDQNVIF